MKISKASSRETLAEYFGRIKSNEAPYPIKLEDVCLLTYSSKSHAIRAIRKQPKEEYSEEKVKGQVVIRISLNLFKKVFLVDENLLKLYDSTDSNGTITPIEDVEVEELPDVLPFFDNAHVTSLDIAKFAKRPHNHIMRDIREIEQVWINQGKSPYTLSTYQSKQNKILPCYLLTKWESLFIITKYDDDARVKLILRWEKVEKENHELRQQPLTQAQFLLQSAQLMVQIEERQQALEQKTDTLANKLNTIEQNQKQAELDLFEIPTTDEPMAEITTRTRVVTLVAKYAEAVFPLDADKYRKAWRFFYDELLKRYHFRAYEDKSRGYTKLDDVEQRGALHYLDIIVSNYVNELNEKNQH